MSTRTHLTAEDLHGDLQHQGTSIAVPARRSRVRTIVIASLVVALSAAGYLGTWCATRHPLPLGPWPLTDTEVIAQNGLNTTFSQFGLVATPQGWQLDPRGQISRITSNSETAQAIGNMILQARGVGAGEVVLSHEAQRSRHLDVALVQSGSTWVELRR